MYTTGETTSDSSARKLPGCDIFFQVAPTCSAAVSRLKRERAYIVKRPLKNSVAYSRCRPLTYFAVNHSVARVMQQGVFTTALPGADPLRRFCATKLRLFRRIIISRPPAATRASVERSVTVSHSRVKIRLFFETYPDGIDLGRKSLLGYRDLCDRFFLALIAFAKRRAIFEESNRVN